jgi:hypothetical protein
LMVLVSANSVLQACLGATVLVVGAIATRWAVVRSRNRY